MGRFAVGLALLAVALSGRAANAVSTPDVDGPITSPGSAFVAGTLFDLAPLGYVQEEFFLSGTASAFTSTAPLGSDGRWTAAPGATAGYTTRVLVHRPASRRRFNGTVIVEWLNVSGGLDAAPDWIFTHSMLMREGYAWVGVSAQAAGISNTGGPIGVNLSLKAIDPVRYAPLQHPGDSFSYDMYSQVAQALRAGAGRLLGGAVPKRVIAAGESQSAFRMVTYINAVHPLAGVYDGFLVHSRGGGAAPLSQAPQPPISAPTPTFIREDVDVPVLTFQSETDLIALGSLAIRQPDTDRIRLWEVAGTAHGDVYQTAYGMSDTGRVALDVTHEPLLSSVGGGFITCSAPINAGQQQYVLSAAVAKLTRWIRSGRAPKKSSPLLEMAPGPVPAFRLDEHGNVLGGIRTPSVDAPIATLSGLGQTGASFCGLFGTTVPLSDTRLSGLYPTQRAYVSAVRRSAWTAVRDGFLLRPEARAITRAAAASDVGG